MSTHNAIPADSLSRMFPETARVFHPVEIQAAVTAPNQEVVASFVAMMEAVNRLTPEDSNRRTEDGAIKLSTGREDHSRKPMTAKIAHVGDETRYSLKNYDVGVHDLDKRAIGFVQDRYDKNGELSLVVADDGQTFISAQNKRNLSMAYLGLKLATLRRSARLQRSLFKERPPEATIDASTTAFEVAIAALENSVHPNNQPYTA